MILIDKDIDGDHFYIQAENKTVYKKRQRGHPDNTEKVISTFIKLNNKFSAIIASFYKDRSIYRIKDDKYDNMYLSSKCFYGFKVQVHHTSRLELKLEQKVSSYNVFSHSVNKLVKSYKNKKGNTALPVTPGMVYKYIRVLPNPFNLSCFSDEEIVKAVKVTLQDNFVSYLSHIDEKRVTEFVEKIAYALLEDVAYVVNTHHNRRLVNLKDTRFDLHKAPPMGRHIHLDRTKLCNHTDKVGNAVYTYHELPIRQAYEMLTALS